jgi:hypothetical protein
LFSYLSLLQAINVYVTVTFSSKDLLMRVVAQNLSPELTLVEKVSSSDQFLILNDG